MMNNGNDLEDLFFFFQTTWTLKHTLELVAADVGAHHSHSYPWFSILHSESVGQGDSSHHLTSSQRRPAVLGGQVQVKSSHVE